VKDVLQLAQTPLTAKVEVIFLGGFLAKAESTRGVGFCDVAFVSGDRKGKTFLFSIVALCDGFIGDVLFDAFAVADGGVGFVAVLTLTGLTRTIGRSITSSSSSLKKQR
jgi:hypothetical protein